MNREWLQALPNLRKLTIAAVGWVEERNPTSNLQVLRWVSPREVVPMNREWLQALPNLRKLTIAV